jgi:hypothetical protein
LDPHAIEIRLGCRVVDRWTWNTTRQGEDGDSLTSDPFERNKKGPLADGRRQADRE